MICIIFMVNEIDNFLERELSYKIIGCFFAVRNKYGSHHQERVFDRALTEEFDLAGIEHVNQPQIDVFSVTTGKKIAFYVPDKLVESKILLELKAKPFTSKDDEMQAQEYLKTSIYEII